jgi:hypothetical protein
MRSATGGAEPLAIPKHAFTRPKSISAVGRSHPEPVRPGQRLGKLRHDQGITSDPAVVTKDGAPYRSYTYVAQVRGFVPFEEDLGRDDASIALSPQLFRPTSHSSIRAHGPHSAGSHVTDLPQPPGRRPFSS